MDDVRLGKSDGDVAVGMGGAVVFQGDRGAVELEVCVVGEDFAREFRPAARGRKL